MGMNDIKNEFDTKAMADDLSKALPMSHAQLNQAFTPDQQKALNAMIADVKKATDANGKAAALQQHVGTALNLLVKLGVAL